VDIVHKKVRLLFFTPPLFVVVGSGIRDGKNLRIQEKKIPDPG
jgi:hypothetical protein